MTNNASFPTPNPPFTEVTAALDELSQAFALARLQNRKSVRAASLRIMPDKGGPGFNSARQLR
jgi:hypothetical protein